MNWEEYKKEAFKTWNFEIKNFAEYIENKIIEELGEILGEYTKWKFNGKTPNYIEELGDLVWYLATYENLTGIQGSFEGRRFGYGSNPIGTNTKVMIARMLDEMDLKYKISSLYGYFNVITKEIGVEMEEICEKNIQKIRLRHGKSYRPEHYRGV